MQAFRALPLLVFATLFATACGGQVIIGSMDDNSNPASSSGSPDGPLPADVPLSARCNDVLAPEVLFDGNANGTSILDFASDGTHIYLATSQGGTSRVLRQGSKYASELAAFGSDLLTGVDLAADFVVVRKETSAGTNLQVLNKVGSGSSTWDTLGAFAATHDQNQLTFARKDTQGAGEEVWGINAGVTSNVFSVGPKRQVRSVAASSRGTFALVWDEASGSTQLLMSSDLMSAKYTSLIELPMTPSAELVLDGDDAYTMLVDGLLDSPNIVRINTKTRGEFQWVATQSPFNDRRVGRFVIDSEHFYYEQKRSNACTPPACTDYEIVRLRKDQPRYEIVKQLSVGGSNGAPLRKFNIDACFLFWNDGERLYRQSKTALAVVP